MKILVTGSSGTIGTRLCERLMAAGHEVHGADWRPNKWSAAVHAKTVSVDLRNLTETLERLPQGIDLVIHLAANARVYDLVVKPSEALDNITTVFNTLEYARLSGVKKIMFASSREVYGNIEGLTHAEDEARIDECESPYAASKIAGEALMRSYHKCYGVKAVIFRFSNVYGMYDESNRFVPILIRQAKANAPIALYDPNKILDFTYIDDCVGGIMLTADNFDKCAGETVNLAYGAGSTLRQVCDVILKLTGSKSEVSIQPTRIGEVRTYVADLTKAKRLLGYRPEVGIEEGIRRSIEWWESEKDRSKA